MQYKKQSGDYRPPGGHSTSSGSSTEIRTFPEIGGFTFEHPIVGDGAQVLRLVRESGVLDENSCYAYLLFCKEFTDTCLVARRDGELHGFVTAFSPPTRPEVIFVWQVGVSREVRGKGLARSLLLRLLALPACKRVEFMESTVTPSNTPSRRLFESVARDLGVPCSRSPCFEPSDFLDEGHETEELFRIGPMERNDHGSL